MVIILLIHDKLYLWARVLTGHDRFIGQRTARDLNASFKTN